MKKIGGYIKLACAIFGEKETDDILNKWNNTDIIPYVEVILKLLTDEEKTIINLRFGLYCDANTIEEIDKKLKVNSKEIESIAIRKMRNPKGPAKNLAKYLKTL